MLALGDAIATAPDGSLVDAAAALFDQALPAARELAWPRAEASVVLGCAAVVGSRSGGLPATDARRFSPPACTSGSFATRRPIGRGRTRR